jgi:hypothetical protein
MKRLKLLKPWHLPTVRLTLDAPFAEPCAPRSVTCNGVPGGQTVSVAPELLQCDARMAVTAVRPWEQQKRLRAPRGNGNFAGTAIPHTGCPHLSI